MKTAERTLLDEIDGCDAREWSRAEALERLTDTMAPVFDWIFSEGLASGGMRSIVMIYCVRPDLIDGATEATIARQFGVTRQAIGKLVSEFRDRFGLRVPTMRSEETRERCRKRKKNGHE